MSGVCEVGLYEAPGSGEHVKWDTFICLLIVFLQVFHRIPICDRYFAKEFGGNVKHFTIIENYSSSSSEMINLSAQLKPTPGKTPVESGFFNDAKRMNPP